MNLNSKCDKESRNTCVQIDRIHFKKKNVNMCDYFCRTFIITYVYTLCIKVTGKWTT